MFFNLLDGDKPVWYPIKFDTVTDIIRSVATWLTLALILTFIITYIVLAARKASKNRFLRVSLITAIAYSAAIILMSLILFFIEEELVGLIDVVHQFPFCSMSHYWRQLKHVANEDYLFASEGQCGAQSLAQRVVDGIHYVASHH